MIHITYFETNLKLNDETPAPDTSSILNLLDAGRQCNFYLTNGSHLGVHFQFLIVNNNIIGYKNLKERD
jgi:hypothetical protein